MEEEEMSSVVIKLLDFTTSEMCIYAHAHIRCIGSPKITLRFEDSLKGLTELRKAPIPMVMVYYKSVQIKISNEKWHIRWRLGETRLKLLVVLSQWTYTDSWQCLMFPATTCDNKWG